MKINSRAGFSLVEVVIGSAIAGIIVLTLASLINVTQQVKKTSDRREWLQQLRVEVFRTLNTRKAWENTLGNGANASLACVRNRTSCAGQSGELLLMDAANAVFDGVGNPAIPSAGLDRYGTACSGFTPAGNPDCPFRYVLRWDALCDDAGCAQFQIRLVAQLLYAPGSSAQANFNPKTYDFTILKDESTPSIENLCAASGGTFDIASGTCILGPDANCAFPFLLVGFTAQGLKMCGQYIPVRCPIDQVLTAVDPIARTVTCSPACNGGSSVTLPFGDLAP